MQWTEADNVKVGAHTINLCLKCQRRKENLCCKLIFKNTHKTFTWKQGLLLKLLYIYIFVVGKYSSGYGYPKLGQEELTLKHQIASGLVTLNIKFQTFNKMCHSLNPAWWINEISHLCCRSKWRGLHRPTQQKGHQVARSSSL